MGSVEEGGGQEVRLNFGQGAVQRAPKNAYLQAEMGESKERGTGRTPM